MESDPSPDEGKLCDYHPGIRFPPTSVSCLTISNGVIGPAGLLSGFVVMAAGCFVNACSAPAEINVMATRSNTSGFDPSRTVRSLERYVSNEPESRLSSNIAKATRITLSGPFPNNATGHDAAGHLCRYPRRRATTTFLGCLFILTRLDQRPRRICSGC